jgi:hypothetical protein
MMPIRPMLDTNNDTMKRKEKLVVDLGQLFHPVLAPNQPVLFGAKASHPLLPKTVQSVPAPSRLLLLIHVPDFHHGNFVFETGLCGFVRQSVGVFEVDFFLQKQHQPQHHMRKCIFC